MKKIFVLSLFFISVNMFGQDIPRQGFWGIYTVPLSDSLKTENSMTTDAVEIVWIKPESAEEEIGLELNDILIQINDEIISSPSDIVFSGLLNELRSGEDICYHLIRNKKKMKLCGKIKPKPYEENLNAEVIYDQVKFKNGYLRTIITKPKSDRKLPAIYFIPGYNCASYDYMSSIHPYKRIIDSLTNLGYAVFRCEKSGMGDSYNTPNCFEIDFTTEQLGFEKGYEKLLKYDFVDPDNIYIFGHSLGGINAPIIAEKYNPKGVIVYGTSHLPWMEYITNMIRFQNPKLGVDPIEMEQNAKTYQSLLYDHYVLKLSPLELVEKNEKYLHLLERDFMFVGGDMMFQRHYSFMQQLNNLNLTKSWASTTSKVLSIYGEADFEAINSDSHREIVRIVNYYHEGNGTFLLLPETNHSFIKVGSMQDGLDATAEGMMRSLLETNFNFQIITEIDQWIKGLE